LVAQFGPLGSYLQTYMRFWPYTKRGKKIFNFDNPFESKTWSSTWSL